jgi:type 1 glutamine amidotransferase
MWKIFYLFPLLIWYGSLPEFGIPPVKGPAARAEGNAEQKKHHREDRQAPRKRLKVLLVDGQNNHDTWREGSAIMQSELEATGLFEVEIARTPAQGSPMAGFRPDFSKYDVVLSNYNGDDWPETTQKDFEQFVYRGGGFVVVHAADNAFPKWQAYNRMTGIGGWNGRTEKDGPYLYINEQGETIRDSSPGPGGHHGPKHEFVVQVRDFTHPITQGMPRQWLHTRDELYDLMRGPAEQVQILISAYSSPAMDGTGRHEPSAMAIRFGKGRIFHTTMGHDPVALRCIGFITLLQRGTEWAATGNVTQALPSNFPTAERSASK